MNIFTVGDIHGCSRQLESLLSKLLNNSEFNNKRDLLIFLGDYIDRGPNSREVIDQLINCNKRNIKAVFLMGNHEQMIIDFLFDKINNLMHWLNLGADQTFKSYDIEVAKFIKDGFEDDNIDKLRNVFLDKLGKEHVYFLKNLKLTYNLGDYLFVHAGINPEKSLSEQNKMDFLWSRSDKFFDKNFKSEKVIVHGHTPEKEVVNFPYRINIDTGCFFSGKLSCVYLNDQNNKRQFIYS